MTNLSLKNIVKQQGAAALLITSILLVGAILIMIFATSYTQLQQKTAANQYSKDQAYEAAEAGLEFAVPYLNQNSTAILASQISGFIQPYTNASTTNVALANGSRYNIVYSNPTASNYELILITVTGTSADGTSSRTVSQLVQQRPILANPPINPMSSIGSVSLSGSSRVSNPSSNFSIRTGSTVSMSGSSGSSAASGSSSPGNIGPDIQVNSAPLQSVTSDQYFMSYFGADANTVKNSVDNYYASGSNPNLNGMMGTSIWVDGDLNVSGNKTIGSATQPVLLIVNGNVRFNGNITFYGFLYIINFDFTSSGNTDLTGGIATGGDISISGNSDITFDTSIISNVASTGGSSSSGGSYAKVTGTWRDF